MSKTIRFVLRGNRTECLPIFALTLILMAGNLLFPGNFFRTYLNSAFLMFFLILYILGNSFACTYTQIALTMGVRRKDIFWANQVQILLYTAECWLCLFLLDKFALAHGLDHAYGWGVGHVTNAPANLLALFLSMLCGYVFGLLMRKHKWLGIVAMFLFMTVGSGLIMFMLAVTGDMDGAPGLWGDMTWFLPLLHVLLIAAAEAALWAILRRETV